VARDGGASIRVSIVFALRMRLIALSAIADEWSIIKHGLASTPPELRW
jgi:hypothetical protein